MFLWAYLTLDIAFLTACDSGGPGGLGIEKFGIGLLRLSNVAGDFVSSTYNIGPLRLSGCAGDFFSSSATEG